MGLGIPAPVTALTLDQGVTTMEFNKNFRAGTGETMQSVDVLGENGAKLPRAFQANDRVMDVVRPGEPEHRPSFKLIIPVLDSRRFRGHEILEVNGPPASPYTLRPTEIRNAAAGRNTGTGEDERPMRRANVVCQRHVSTMNGVRVVRSLAQSLGGVEGTDGSAA